MHRARRVGAGGDPAVEGPRGCRPAELEGVIGLVDAAMRQGSDQSMRTDYPLVYAPDNLANVQVIVSDGRPVATAPVLPRRVAGDGFAFGMGVISPTATDPDHRHRGYGSACVAACVERMTGLGLELSVLWTLVATFPFYERNGWQAVGRGGGSVRLTADDAGRFRRWGGPISRLADEPDRLVEVLALHDALRPGVLRSVAEAEALWSLPRMTTWLAMDGARVMGTLVESHAVNKPGLLEAAGHPATVGGLVGHVLARLPAGAAIDAHVDAAPDPLPGAIAAALPDRAPIPSVADMMVRINDPAALMASIRGWLERRVPATERPTVSVDVVDAGATISFDWSSEGLALGSERRPDHVQLTRRELTSVVFGAHPERPVPRPPALDWLPPFRLPIPILDRS